ncbi:C40 family peptidase [Streptomyces phyllanthi]|uniref:NlpC/P60 family protein n=1 Tax=Streptomyces phyllanthi TaxID=1803180 RepID=A0A5N8VTB5_9ACTN|nr:C40 family peptidase [Streptomyces phyllanthi]MPY38483.1 NlpC/P60 family protein [Streptomyces phyllanthi]
MKVAATTVGAVVLSPLLLAGTAAVAAATSGAAQQEACSTASTSVDADAVADAVANILNGKKADADIAVVGLDLPDEQIPNAKTIVAAGIAMKVPTRGQIVALATALQESRLRNLAYGDRDSLGLFQQRPSQGWGTAEQVRDPVYASRKFYKALLKVDGWQQMTITQAAQAVQKSGYPGAYAKWENIARALQKAIAKVLPQGSAFETTNDDDESNAVSLQTGCDDDTTDFGTIPAGALPQGYEIPKGAPKKVQLAIRWGLTQLNTPYQWGGDCTDADGPDPMKRCDCSSLMQQSYASAKVKLSRTTYTQVNEGKKVSVNALKPGDLLFTEGSASAPEHVGMYIGRGLVLHAPHTGDVVRVVPLADWKPRVLAARRIVN